MSDDTLFEDLNPQQRAAVEALDGPLLVVAGAGSGKTRVLTYRIVNILRSRKAYPGQILAITFTNRAAAEMRERVANLVGDDARSMWVLTFHAACGRILRREAEHVGYTSSFSIYDQGDQVRLVKRCIAELDLDVKRFAPQAVHARISNAKNTMIDADEYAAQASNFFDESVADIYRLYDKRMRENNAMDFDDMLLNTVRLLTADEAARERWQQRFRYVLVDEYQDTNKVQYELLRLLVAGHHNLCCVGDSDQSIYSWRGADIRNILQFEDDFPGAQTVVLDQNYRSTQHILDAANSVVANNSQRQSKRLWSELGAGEVVRVMEVEDEHAEARFVADAVEREISAGRSANEIAVFYRTNAQSRPIEDQFTRRGIDYQIIGAMKFYERAEIKDVLAYLRLLVNPDDTVAFTRVVNVPKRGIGTTTVNKVVDYLAATGCSLHEFPFHLGQSALNAATQRKLASFFTLLDELRSAIIDGEMAIADAIELIYERSGLVRALKDEDSLESEGRLENLGQLVTAAGEYDTRANPPSVADYLEGISLQADADLIDRGSGTVTVMTMHNAKGLEYPVVLVAGLEEGLFPHSRSVQEGNVDEERRLCYVVITRAQERLTLLHATSRSVFGRRQYCVPSRFLEELPSESVQRNKRNPASWSASGAAAVPWAQPSGRRAPAREPGRRSSGGFPGSLGPTGPSSYSSAPQRRNTSDAPQLHTGDAVRHASFGEGVVIGVERNEIAVVRFADTGDERRLMIAYAPLERIE